MIKIFGEHDEKTVQQLWTCMGVGSVYKGVLCTDGHYGYAQPVGGVVAYEKQRLIRSTSVARTADS